MRSEGELGRNQFVARMMEALQQVKGRYAARAPVETVSLPQVPVLPGDAFAEKIRSCRQLLDAGDVSARSSTLIKIDELKCKINQISVDELRRSFNKRNDVSLDNFRRTIDELDVKGYNDMLHSLDLNDFQWLRHQERIVEGGRRLARVVLRNAMKRVAAADRFGALRAWSGKLAAGRKKEVMDELRRFSAQRHLNLKVEAVSAAVCAVLGGRQRAAKANAFGAMKARAQLAGLACNCCDEARAAAMLQLRQFAVVFKINATLQRTMRLALRRYKVTALQALRRNAACSNGLTALMRRVGETQRYTLKVGLTQLVSYVGALPKQVEKGDEVQLLQPVRGAGNMPTGSIPYSTLTAKHRNLTTKRVAHSPEVRKAKRLSGSAHNVVPPVDPNGVERVAGAPMEDVVLRIVETTHELNMAETVISERSYRERGSLPDARTNQQLNLIESRIIPAQPDTRPPDEPRSGSLRDCHKSDSLSRLELNSCLKESVPDSEFIRYCEMVFSSKKVNYNFSLDNIDVFRNSRQRTEAEGERGESGSFHEHSPAFRDIDQLMQFARRLNNSCELKDQTLDFLRSVDMDVRQRSSVHAHSDVSLQKKESIKLIGEAGALEQAGGLAAGDGGAQWGEVPVEQALQTVAPLLAGRGSFDAMKDRRELTAIKEESTVFDRSNVTASKNQSHMIESRDMVNSIKKQQQQNSESVSQPNSLKQNASGNSRKLKISPKNSEAKRDASKGSQIIRHIEGIRGDFASHSMLEQESCASSGSSDGESSTGSDVQVTGGALQRHAAGFNRSTTINRIDGKRASLHDRFNATLNCADGRRLASRARPASNFDLKKWHQNFKSTIVQYKGAATRASNAHKQSGGKQGERRTTAAGGRGAVVCRLKTDDMTQSRPVPRAFSRTIQHKLSQHQSSFVAPTPNYSSGKVRPSSNFRRIKLQIDEGRPGATATKPRVQVRGAQNTTRAPPSNLCARVSPAPRLRTAKPPPVERAPPKTHAGKNFVDKNKKIAFENNIAKYFPKLAEPQHARAVNAHSFTGSRSAKHVRPGLPRNHMGECRAALRITRARSVQYKTSQKSFFNVSALGKENGGTCNGDGRRSQNLTQKFARAHSHDTSLRAGSCKSRVETLRAERSRFLQRRADSKFFDVG